MEKDLLLPASIFAGCTVIAVGLYLGLQGRPQASGATVSAPATVPAPPPAAVPPGAALPAAPGLPSPALQAATEGAARKALLAQKRDLFLPKCWEPAVKKAPGPGLVNLTFDMTFNAEGNEITRGISEDRSAAWPEVATCIRALPDQIRLSPPPGMAVHVNLPLELP